jgi:hypothetical protein
MPNEPQWRRLHYTLSFFWKGEDAPTTAQLRQLLIAQLRPTAAEIENLKALPPELDARSMQLESGSVPAAWTLTRTPE